jgi:hypothetical protein
MSDTNQAKQNFSAITSGKARVVIKRRNKPVKAALSTAEYEAALQVRRRPGIPSFAPAASRLQTAQQEDHDATDLLDEDDSIFHKVACETLLVAQSLSRNPMTSLSIPYSTHGSRSIYGVLSCQLYNALQSYSQTKGIGADIVVSRELQLLLRDNTLVQLAEAGKVDSDDSLNVLLLAQDYIQIVHDIQGDQKNLEAVHWFTKHLEDWKGSVITHDNVHRVYANDPLGTTASLDETLACLCQAQVLMPCRRNNASSSTSNCYQYWLPTWGVVVQAWNKARVKLVALLKRSHYKERQEQALQQPHSPIPTRLLVDWLVSQGQVERVERASGNVIRLVCDE